MPPDQCQSTKRQYAERYRRDHQSLITELHWLDSPLLKKGNSLVRRQKSWGKPYRSGCARNFGSENRVFELRLAAGQYRHVKAVSMVLLHGRSDSQTRTPLRDKPNAQQLVDGIRPLNKKKTPVPTFP